MPSEVTNLSNFQVVSPGSTKPSPSVRSTDKSESGAAAAPDTRQILPGGNAEISSQATLAVSPEVEEVSAEELEQAVDSINANLQNLQRSLHFSVDEELGRTIVKVLDSDTDEVIRQIPSEEVLAIARTIEDMTPEDQAGGLFFKGEV